MKSTALLLVVAAIFLAAQGRGAVAAETRTLSGEFVWSARDSGGDLEAVFTPTAEGQWDVAFHFEFRGQPHVYSGTAEGSLADGDLSGKVLNESKERTFRFSGSFKEGTFSGSHSEISGEREQKTGSLTLKE